MKGYIYIEHNKVVWNPEEKPNEDDYCYMGDWYGKQVEMLDSYHLDNALKQWQSECVEVENHYAYWGKSKIHYLDLPGNKQSSPFTPGTQATIEGNTITKLS